MLGFDIVGTGAHRVIVLNDWLCDTSTWASARPYLDRDAFAWAFADVRGYGRSREQRGTFTIEEAAADVLALADELAWAQFSVVGHSMSTIAALHLAQTSAERITSAVLVTPPPPASFHYDEATQTALREVALGDDTRRARALEVMLGSRLSPAWLRFKLERWRATSDPHAVAGYLPMFGVSGVPDLTTRLACPVLAITGDEDALPMRREAAAQNLAPLCSQLTLVSIPGCGHYPMQETPPHFVALVEKFLAGR